MSLIDTSIACGICTNNYSDGTHAPVLFQCGHGCCQGCATQLQHHAAQTAICHQCRTPITMSFQNYELADQIHNAAEKMKHLLVEALKNPQKVRTDMIETAISTLLSIPPSEFAEKLKKLVSSLIEFGCYNSPEEAFADLLSKVQDKLVLGAYKTLDQTTEDNRDAVIHGIAIGLSNYTRTSPDEIEPQLRNGYLAFCLARDLAAIPTCENTNT